MACRTRPGLCAHSAWLVRRSVDPTLRPLTLAPRPRPFPYATDARCQDLGLPYEMSVDDIVNPDPREMMVFVLYLHHTLPQFVPRANIEFACKLGETQVGFRV